MDGSASDSERAAGPAGEELHDGPPTRPREAAAVILLREPAGVPEVLLVRRTPRARFMPGVWVFPGGAVEPAAPGPEAAPAAAQPVAAQRDADRHADRHRESAVRELYEEAGVALGERPDLVEFSRWITPAEVRTRFDTRFFLARLPLGMEARVDGEECVDLLWTTPSDALASWKRGALDLVFPTIKQLEELSAFGDVAELLQAARAREPAKPIQPRIVGSGEKARVLLPGEDGYRAASSRTADAAGEPDRR